MSEWLLSMRGIKKSFHGIQALKGVDLSLKAGEVLSIVGMNGAGKSTLSHIIAGIHTPDFGEIFIKGKRADIQSPKDAERLGIGMVTQEPTLCENMTVAENVFLNNEMVRYGVVLSRKKMRAECLRILDFLGYCIDPDALVEDLPLVSKGVIAIARAMLMDPSVLILDEVTAPLSSGEVDHLFSVIGELKARGIGIIYIGHKLQEIIEISDRIAVVRDGEVVGEFMSGEGAHTSEADIIHLMLGEAEGWESEFKERNYEARADEVLLATSNLTKTDLYRDISINLHKREIIGLAGLKGSGITEFMLSLFGAIKPDSGEIVMSGRPISPSNPKQAKAVGIGMITNDRQKEGLAMMLPIEDNIVISSLDKLSNKLGVMRPGEVTKVAERFIKALGLKTTGPSQLVQYLSGGNQQKVVVAKWLQQDCQIILVDEPTRGVDVKAKNQIYDLLTEQKMANKGVVVHSPEVRELLSLCDRIIVMSRGEIVAEVSRGDELFTEKGLLGAIHAFDGRTPS